MEVALPEAVDRVLSIASGRAKLQNAFQVEVALPPVDRLWQSKTSKCLSRPQSTASGRAKLQNAFQVEVALPEVVDQTGDRPFLAETSLLVLFFFYLFHFIHDVIFILFMMLFSF